MDMTQISIIGGGVAGLCVARVLRDRGADVQVVDRHDGIGPHACSWWAGGMLAPFCEGESAEEPVVRLGQEAADWWQAKTDAVNRCGTLVVSPARDKAELSRFGRRTSHFTTVSGAEIEALEPDLAGRFNTGLFFKDEAHLSPRLALGRLRDGLVADGVTFKTEDADPKSYAREGLTVDCRGFAARDAISDLRGVKGEMLILSCKDVVLNRPVRLLHPRIPLYVVPRGDGIFMLGATMIESSQKTHVTARSLLELLSAAYALNPAFGEAEVLEIGVDARPAFPDNLPRIRRDGNLICANGLFRHGFLLAPALARMVAEMIFDNTKPEMMDETSA
jgi:glycine oxidase